MRLFTFLIESWNSFFFALTSTIVSKTSKLFVNMCGSIEFHEYFITNFGQTENNFQAKL